MTRINPIYTRAYINGYDVSGWANNTGALGFTTDAGACDAYADAVKNYVMGRVEIQAGPLNSYFAPSATTGLHELMKSSNNVSDLFVSLGTTGEPQVGEPVFAWRMLQTSYKTGGDSVIGANIDFGGAAYTSGVAYSSPFGVLLHAKGAETAVNTAIATVDAGASTTLGGVFDYHLLSSNGTVTLSAQDATTNTNVSFSAITGATSGSINASTTPVSGFVELSTTATIRRYVRWQLAFGTATTATFVCALIRGA